MAEPLRLLSSFWQGWDKLGGAKQDGREADEKGESQTWTSSANIGTLNLLVFS